MPKILVSGAGWEETGDPPQAAHHKRGIRALGLRLWDFTQDCYCSPSGERRTRWGTDHRQAGSSSRLQTQAGLHGTRGHTPLGVAALHLAEPPGSHDTREPPPAFTEWTGPTQDPTFAAASSGWGRARRWR